MLGLGDWLVGEVKNTPFTLAWEIGWIGNDGHWHKRNGRRTGKGGEKMMKSLLVELKVSGGYPGENVQ